MWLVLLPLLAAVLLGERRVVPRGAALRWLVDSN
jgi:hypothetical protein